MFSATLAEKDFSKPDPTCSAGKLIDLNPESDFSIQPIMNEQMETKRVVRVGPDQVTITPEEVAIDCKHPMPDWEVREFTVPPIYFEDKKYYLVHKTKAAAPYTIRYLLKPWPETGLQPAKFFHNYDEEAVAQRDGARRSGHASEVGYACLVPFYPFLGLLWSGLQKRLIPFGFVPHTITGISVFTVFALLFGQGVFTVITMNATLRTGKMMIGGFVQAMFDAPYLKIGSFNFPIGIIDGLLALAFVADVAIRYSNYLRDDQWSGGFLEWIFRRAPKQDLD